MRRVAFLVAIGLALAGTWLAFRRVTGSSPEAGRDTLAAKTPAPERHDTALEARLEAIVHGAPAVCGIAAKHLGTGAVARVNADTAVPLMSVVKLPIAIVVLDGVDQGRWPLDTAITLIAQDMHPRGWIGDRFPRGGGPVKLHRLVVEMITRSDNSAADALLRLVGGPSVVMEWLKTHEIRGLRVDRTERGLGNDWYGVAPGADSIMSAEEVRELRAQVPEAVQDRAARAMQIDPRDTGTAQACVDLLERLWTRELLSAAMTDTLKSILGRCKTAPRRLPALLPKGTPVARKTGTGGTWKGVTVAINDVGVIRLPDGGEVAIAVLVGEPRGSVPRAERVIARVARAVYDAWYEEGSGGRP